MYYLCENIINLLQYSTIEQVVYLGTYANFVRLMNKLDL